MLPDKPVPYKFGRPFVDRICFREKVASVTFSKRGRYCVSNEGLRRERYRISTHSVKHFTILRMCSGKMAGYATHSRIRIISFIFPEEPEAADMEVRKRNFYLATLLTGLPLR